VIESKLPNQTETASWFRSKYIAENAANLNQMLSFGKCYLSQMWQLQHKWLSCAHVADVADVARVPAKRKRVTKTNWQPELCDAVATTAIAKARAPLAVSEMQFQPASSDDFVLYPVSCEEEPDGQSNAKQAALVNNVVATTIVVCVLIVCVAECKH
jgi:hypothetical protein